MEKTAVKSKPVARPRHSDGGRDQQPLKAFRGKPKGQGSQTVHSVLRERILSLELWPGENLDELKLVKEFRVSRTPVREALIRLASDGLVSTVPNRGTRVAPLNVTDVPQLLEALELYERATNRWAAIRRGPEDIRLIQARSNEFTAAARARDFRRMSEANKDFHEAISRSCGNKHVADHCSMLLASTLRLARMAFTRLPSAEDQQDYYDEVVRQHEAMVDAIRRQDSDAADMLACQHAKLFRSKIQNFISASQAADLVLSDQR